MKQFILLNLFCFIIYPLISQENTTIPPSPKSSLFLKYGDVPVSHSSGVPDISIPLYTIKSGDLEIPIVLKYHIRNVKPGYDPSDVGLGWTLDFGGQISRTIYGSPDDATLIPPNPFPYYQLNQDIWDHANYLNMCYNNLYDTENDIFHLQAFGYSESFVLKRNSYTDYKPYLLSFKPLKIETATSYHSLPASKQLISTITVKDEKGSSYIFGDNMHETCLSTSSKYGITTWLLKQVTDVSGTNFIRYTYTPTQRLRIYDPVGKYTAILNDSGQLLSLRDDETTPSISVEYGCLDNDFLQDIEYDGMIISGIEFNTGKIVFDIDASKNQIKGFKVFDKNNKVVTQIIFQHSIFSSSTNHRKLESVKILGDDLNISKAQTYSFIYNSGTMNSNYRGTDYWGYYNGTMDDCTRRNYWYKDTEQNSRSVNVTIGTNTNEPSLSYSLYETLTKIIYPTKGETEFTYELNSYDMSPIRTAGGLRIKKIINRDLTGSEVTKEYIYEKGILKHDVFADYNYADSYFSVVETPYSYAGNSFVYRNRYYSNLLQGDLAHNDVRYEKVSEIYKNGIYDEGKNIYHYTFPISNIYDIYTSNISDDPGKSVIRERKDENFSLPTLTENYKRDISTGNYLIIRKETNEYTFYPDTIFENFKVFRLTRFSSGGLLDEWNLRNFLRDYSWIIISNTPFEYYKLFGLYDYSIVAGRLKMNEKQIITYNYEGSTPSTITEKFTYTYDNPKHNYVTRKTSVTSDGNTNVSQVLYPYDYNNYIFNPLIINNVVNRPVSDLTYINGKMISGTLLKYNAIGKVTDISHGRNELGTPFLIDKNNPYNWGTLEQQFQYSSNNISEQYKIGTEQLKTVYLWSYSNQYPIAEIVNASYSDVEAALGGANSVMMFSIKINPSTSEIKTFLAPLSSNIKTKDALITYYTYKPLVGMTSKTDPNGLLTTYEYDSFGRLQYIKDHNGKLIEQYDYHYKP